MKNKFFRIIFFFVVLFINACSYCHLWGAQSLGNNFILMEGDEEENRLIVYCTGRSGGCCDAGIPVIPSRKDTFSSYIADASSNRQWLIANTINWNKSISYWIVNKDFEINLDKCEIIDCDSTIQSHILGPLNFISFQNKIKELKINLNLKKK